MGRKIAPQIDKLPNYKTCTFGLNRSDSCKRFNSLWCDELKLGCFSLALAAPQVPDLKFRLLWLKAGFITFNHFEIYSLGKRRFYSDWQDYQLARRLLEHYLCFYGAETKVKSLSWVSGLPLVVAVGRVKANWWHSTMPSGALLLQQTHLRSFPCLLSE